MVGCGKFGATTLYHQPLTPSNTNTVGLQRIVVFGILIS